MIDDVISELGYCHSVDEGRLAPQQHPRNRQRGFERYVTTRARSNPLEAGRGRHSLIKGVENHAELRIN